MLAFEVNRNDGSKRTLHCRCLEVADSRICGLAIETCILLYYVGKELAVQFHH